MTESGIDTIGELENLRAAISNGKKEWPKGIGKAKITETEDAVITWLTKNRDAGAFSQIQQAGGNAPAVDPSTGESSAPATDSSSSTYPTSNEWESWTDSKRTVYLTERAAAINTGKENCMAKLQKDGNHWEAGYESFERGNELTDCPYSPGEWQDDWIRGYLAGDAVEDYGSDQESGESSDGLETEADESNTSTETELSAEPEAATGPRISDQSDNYGMANEPKRWTVDEL